MRRAPAVFSAPRIALRTALQQPHDLVLLLVERGAERGVAVPVEQAGVRA